MLFSSIIVLAATIASLGAPVKQTPNRVPVKGKSFKAATTGFGWPTSVDDDGSSFGITKDPRTATSFIQEVDGAPALVAKYTNGSYAGAQKPNPGIAGFIFEGNGGSSTGLDNALEAELHYEIKFDPGFEFVLGGKIPGLYGGDNPEVAKTCAGGNHNDDCWSARLMWRENGKGELYGYLPTPNEKLPVCKGKCDVKFGASLGRGNFTFTPGKWAVITERVKLNTVGKSDGEIEVKVDGQSKIRVNGLQLRSKNEGKIRGAMIHTFFGGSSKPDFASTKDQGASFRKFTIVTTKTLDGSDGFRRSIRREYY